jgi:hypothetical protein
MRNRIDRQSRTSLESGRLGSRLSIAVHHGQFEQYSMGSVSVVFDG